MIKFRHPLPLIAALAVLAAAGLAFAQGFMDEAPPVPLEESDQGSWDEFKERILDRRMERLTERLELSESQAAAIRAILSQFMDDTKVQRDALHEASKALRQELSNDTPDETAVTKYVSTIRSAHIRISQLKVNVFDAMSAVLTPIQQGKLVLGHMWLANQRMRHRGMGRPDDDIAPMDPEMGPGPEVMPGF